jgi:hypothetical protein
VDAAGFVGYISPMLEHQDNHKEESHLTEMDLRVRALETILVGKGYLETAALDRKIIIVNTHGWPVMKILPKSQNPGPSFTIGLSRMSETVVPSGRKRMEGT